MRPARAYNLAAGSWPKARGDTTLLRNGRFYPEFQLQLPDPPLGPAPRRDVVRVTAARALRQCSIASSSRRARRRGPPARRDRDRAHPQGVVLRLAFAAAVEAA
jgi:hypothetical protein